MSTTTGDVIIKIFILLYDLILVAGTSYLVTFHDWSMWTFVLTYLFFFVPKNKKDSEEKQ